MPRRKTSAAPEREGDPVFTRNLLRALEERDLSASDFARALDVTPQAVNQWLKCQTAPSRRRLDQIAAVLGMTTDDLRSSEAKTAGWFPPKDTFVVPAWSVDGAPANEMEGGSWIIPAGFLRGLVSPDPDLAVLQVTGADLEPELTPGDTVIVDRNWRSISSRGTYLLGDAKLPTLRWCEPVVGAVMQGDPAQEIHRFVSVEGSKHHHVRLRENGVGKLVPAAALNVVGRVICRLLVPL